jgi:hypothetical protein
VRLELFAGRSEGVERKETLMTLGFFLLTMVKTTTEQLKLLE